MSAPWTGRLRTYGLLGAAVIVFAASLGLSFHRMQQQHAIELRDAGEHLWLVSQADYELQRLRNTLDLYALGGEVDHDALIERFDIFWSRLPLLIEGPDRLRIEGAPATIERLIAELEELEPQIAALDVHDRAAYSAIAARLAGWVEPLHDLVIDVDAAMGFHDQERQARGRRLYLEQIAYLTGIVLSGGILIGLLLRETGRTRRLLAEANAAQERAWHLAHHDPLTNLPNRWLFEDRLAQALRRAQRQGELVAFHYLDLDDFKRVNDDFGHAAGDRLLVAVARRLQGCVRESDTLARIGGDEFALVQVGLADSSGALLLAERLVAALRAPLPSAAEGTAEPIVISACIGIALFPKHADSAEALYRAADRALYRVKAAGDRAYRLAQPDDGTATGRVARRAAG